MKNFLLKTWLIMICLLFGVGTMWADHTLVRANQMVSGDKYIITAVYNNTTYYLAPASFSAGNTGCGTYSSNLTEASAWTFTKSGDSWTISTEVNGTKYYLSHKDANNGVQSTSTSAVYAIAASTTGSNTVKLTSNGRALSLYQGSNWRCYSSSSGVQTITLYKVNSSTPSYTLSLASNTQGTFSAKVDGNAVTSGSKVEAGKIVTLTAEPKDGYVFNSWNVYKTANQYNYVTVAENNTFTMPSEAVTVDAYFIEGKTIPDAQVSLSAGTYRGEQTVTVTNLDEDEYSYYYTLDGTTPAIDEGMNLVGTTQEYNGAINITESCTLSILTTDLTDTKVNAFDYVIEYPYTVTIEEPTNGTLTVMLGDKPVNSGDKVYEGSKITATATPVDGYKFRNVQFTDASAHTFTASNVKEWTMGNHNVTISATFDPIEYYTISFSINGAVQSVLYEENASVTAPAVEDINGKKFVGWVKSTVTVNPETAPSYETIGKATENVTYVAVFAEESAGGGSTNYILDNATISAQYVGSGSNATTNYAERSISEWTGKYNISKNGDYTGIGLTHQTDDSKANYGSYLLTPEFTDAITRIRFQGYDASKAARHIILCEEFKATATTSDAAYGWGEVPAADGPHEFDVTIDVTGEPTQMYIKAGTGAIIITDITVTTGSDATYSNFTTLPVPLAEANVTISSVEYATYYNAFAYTMPANVVGKIMKKNDAGAIASEEVFTEGDVVPAETALLLKGTAATYTLVENRTPATKSVEGNLLHGLLEDGTTTGGGDGAKYYKFANGGKGLGWYYGSSDNTDGHAFSIAANKAYLVIEADEAMSSVRFISVEGFEGTITEIESVNAVDQNAEIFDLQGRRVRNTQSGVYVINGKKVIR